MIEFYYYNGGLKYIQDQWENDELQVSNYMFVDLMNE